MAIYMIGYDLNKEGAAYSQANKTLTEKIREMFPTFWHHLDATWLVKSDLTAIDIANKLWAVMDSNDELLVIEHSGAAAWAGFDEKGAKWLKDNL